MSFGLHKYYGNILGLSHNLSVIPQQIGAVKIVKNAVKVFQFATKLFELIIMIMISSKDGLGAFPN